MMDVLSDESVEPGEPDIEGAVPAFPALDLKFLFSRKVESAGFQGRPFPQERPAGMSAQV